MPISIPVIEMIEIGAGGGSIAWRRCDGADPGRTAKRRLGARPCLLPARRQRADDHRCRPGARQARPRQFRRRRHPAFGRRGRRRRSTRRSARSLGIDADHRGLSASARWSTRTWPMPPASMPSRTARNISDYIMIAFGGAAPLHAARLCEKLGIDSLPGAARRGRRVGDRLPEGAVRLRGGAHPASCGCSISTPATSMTSSAA